MSALPMSGRHTDASDSSSSRGDAMWNTPTVEDAGRNGSAEWARRWASGETIPETQQRLRTQALWPTPAAMMPSDSEDPQVWLARAALLKEKHHNGNGAGTPLAVAVKLAQWPSPGAEDHRDRGTIEDACIRRRVEIGKQINLSMSVAGSLSAAWVERLMGFPDNWTSPLTDGPSAPTKRNPKTSPRASRAKSR